MKKIKIGQIGIGHNHGEAKMLAVRKFPQLFEVVGYAEPNQKWIEKRGSLGAYKGLKRMSVEQLIDGTDALLIESDVWDLDKYAKHCVQKGKHIHMDKPAGEISQFKSVLDIASSKNLVVQMGYMYRYNPAVQKCIEQVKNGSLGEIYSINAEMSTFHSAEYRSWLKNFSGGIMYILGSHMVDLIVYLLGEPNKVLSVLKQTGRDNVYALDNNFALLEYDKAIAKISVSSAEVNGWGRRQFYVCGQKGTINICPIEKPMTMTYSSLDFNDKHYSDVKEQATLPELSLDSRYDQMVKDFYDYIMGNKQNPFTYEHDYLVQKVLSDIVGGVKFYGNDID